MAQIVVVHGMGKRLDGPLTLHNQQFPALQQGMIRAGRPIAPEEVEFASYGELFRAAAEVLSPAPYASADDLDEIETELLFLLWERAAATDGSVLPPAEETLGGSRGLARHALNALSRSRFFAGVAERLLVGDLREVASYLGEQSIRDTVRGRVAELVTPATKVIVGHSLGSVVAYEVLCEHDEWDIAAFVTLGSPLGLPNLVFDRLQPAPVNSRGRWPGRVARWTNVAAGDDVVAAVEDLRPWFGEEIVQIRVDNGSRAHDMSPYLTERLVGQAIAEGLDS